MKADVLSNGIASSNKIENKQKQKAHGQNGAHDTMSPVAKRAKFENGDIQKSSKGSESLVSDTLEKRHRMIGRATEIHYPECPLYIEYGRGAYLYDANDKPFLDLMNNVAHVGHCHPKVTQASQPNTTTKYQFKISSRQNHKSSRETKIYITIQTVCLLLCEFRE